MRVKLKTSLPSWGGGTLVVHRIESETPPEWVTELDPQYYPPGMVGYNGYYYDVTPNMITQAQTAGKIVYINHPFSSGGVDGWMGQTSMISVLTQTVPPEAGMPYETYWELRYAYYDPMEGDAGVAQVPGYNDLGIIASMDGDGYLVAWAPAY